MEKIASSALKTILLSKRANIYYLEKCRVMQKDGRIVYLTEGKKENLYWNIPIANTTTLLLGTGTSITQAAVRDLAGAGVMIGFCGGGGTPLLAGTEIAWLSPQSEYRPTQYVQDWLAFWYDDAKRLAAAKKFQEARYAFLEKVWDKDRDLQDYGFYSSDLDGIDGSFRSRIKAAPSVSQLLNIEATFTKGLYKYAAQNAGTETFTRIHGDGDGANRLLDHGNYLAYGLAAAALWGLGIPHGFAVMHGKTRRGALVFDVADLVKDAIILPFAFISAQEGKTDQAFRELCLEKFADYGALDFMFDTIKEVCAQGKGVGC